MATGKKPGPSETKSGHDAPWRKRDIEGVVPPGRRLEDEERRGVSWAAAGVRGVIPPGNQKPGEGPAAKWVQEKSGTAKPAKKAPPLRPQKGKAAEEAPAFDPGRPTAGFVPNPAMGANDPGSLKAMLDELAAFFGEHKGDPTAGENLAELIGQSHAPYEIIVAFTILTALTMNDAEGRKKHQWALERGAKAYFNLAMRLDKTVKAPRGLVPQTLDPIFFDLPSTAYQVPFAWAADAFLRQLDLLRGDIAHDRALMRFSRSLYKRFVAQRAFGDRSLAAMFPFEEPAWAPEDDD